MRTVITYGTFDLFHQGHYNILKRAKEEGDYLIVGVTGETYDTERGKLSVQDSLATRIQNVLDTGFVDKVIVEEYLGQKIHDIINYHVDVLVIGSDWKGKFDHLRKYCEVKYLERTKNISSTQLRNENMTIYRFGIVTDDKEDNRAIREAQHVSGIHAESVFSESEEVAKGFQEEHELYSSHTDYQAFLEDVDVVYVKTEQSSRKKYVEAAVRAGKHVVYDVPCAESKEEELALRELAQKQGVVILEHVPIFYLQTFAQLLWMARGNLIGDIIHVDCSISKRAYDETKDNSFEEIAYMPICVISKILGVDYQDVSAKRITGNEGEEYGSFYFTYENATALAQIGMKTDVDCGMTIYGTEGKIHIPDSWWSIGYFCMQQNGETKEKHFSANFEGNGFRYLMQALLGEIRSSNKVEFTRVTTKEAVATIEILKQVRTER